MPNYPRIPSWAVTSLIGVGAVALIIFRQIRNERRLLATLDETFSAWTQLKDTLDSARLQEVQVDQLEIGHRVRVHDFFEVSNSSLWDRSNTDHCNKEGTVTHIDADGDVTVRLDDGTDMTCDVKFLAVVCHKEQTLRRQVHLMGAAIAETQNLVYRRQRRALYTFGAALDG